MMETQSSNKTMTLTFTGYTPVYRLDIRVGRTHLNEIDMFVRDDLHEKIGIGDFPIDE